MMDLQKKLKTTRSRLGLQRACFQTRRNCNKITTTTSVHVPCFKGKLWCESYNMRDTHTHTQMTRSRSGLRRACFQTSRNWKIISTTTSVQDPWFEGKRNCGVSCIKRSTGHTHTHRQRTTPPTPTHTRARREQHPKRTPPTST